MHAIENRTSLQKNLIFFALRHSVTAVVVFIAISLRPRVFA